MATPRLTPEKWLSAGFDALARLGPQAIAAEPLARALGTTKGSFYWHFKDVPAFQEALFASWQADALAKLETVSRLTTPADQQLRQFGQTVIQDSAEHSLRIWANSDSRIASVLTKVDEARQTYLIALLGELGLGNSDFASALQAALIGLPHLAPSGKSTALAPYDTLVDTVLALAQS